jgi:FtsZ-interacting cell division protein ZipA
MSELQLGLAVVGAIVIAAVIGYNKWQEARLAKRADRDFGSRHDDVLVTERTALPETIDESAAPVARRVSDTTATERVEHTMGEVDAPPVPASTPLEGETWTSHTALDARLDCIVTLSCPVPVRGVDALAAARTLDDAGLTRPVRWEGGDASAGIWGPIAPDGAYRNLRAGLQLADRSGPANEGDIGGFFAGMQEVAESLEGELELPDPEEALALAQALDAFCADVDVQIGLNVIATATHPFAGTKLRALAEAGGLRLAGDGTFRRIDDAGHELFSLANSEEQPFDAESLRSMSTKGVSVVLDVPRAPGSVSTFRLYLDFAHQLEQALGGMLVDDNKKPVGQAALDRIGRQLERIYGAMDARGIPAGSPSAQRLFA